MDFISSSDFRREWKKLGLNDVNDIMALRVLIMAASTRPPIIKGTGGLRKIRFAPESWHMGKRGAARVCYVLFQEFGIVYLVTVYGKNEKANISAADRAYYKKLIHEIKRELKRRGTIN
jgi:hypothetical protein